jgi:4-hydroxy-3-polyprenylbenzoate decarboxylase
METALERWQAEGLPALNLKKPWFGYELGHWTDEERDDAAKAIRGEYLDTGERLRSSREDFKD